MTPQELTTLKTEITTDPQSLGYSGKSDEEVADLLNLANRPGRAEVPCWRVKQAAMEWGAWGGLKIVYADPTANVQLRAVVIAAVDWIDDPSGKIQHINMDLPAVGQMLAGLVAGKLITPEQSAALVAFGNALISRATEIGLPPVSYQDCYNARLA